MTRPSPFPASAVGSLWVSILLMVFTLSSHAEGFGLVQEAAGTTSVGIPLRLENIVIPGPLLKASAVDEHSNVIVRIAAVDPHGTARRYDFDFRGLEPGRYNVLEYLETEAGEPVPMGQELWVNVVPVLSADQLQPNPLDLHVLPRLGGYRVLATVAMIVWIVVLIELIRRVFFKRELAATHRQPPATLAAELRALSQKILAGGTRSQTDLARLESLLLGYWRERLGWQHLDAHVAQQKLLKHPEAGQLLREVQEALHRPDGPSKIDWDTVLAPYRDAPDSPGSSAAEVAV